MFILSDFWHNLLLDVHIKVDVEKSIEFADI